MVACNLLRRSMLFVVFSLYITKYSLPPASILARHTPDDLHRQGDYYSAYDQPLSFAWRKFYFFTETFNPKTYKTTPL
jgi:hypothetical protein